MPRHKKIDKKKAVTFQLVHRSQQDPLIADEDAPQRILVPVQDKKEKKLEEQHKYGIYYDDDYDYLENLKDVKDNSMKWPDHVEKELSERTEKTKLQLPKSVFASEKEEEIGMLAKGAPVYGPQLHLDPDVVAAMDEDFDYSDPENQLEDNFIELAMGVASDQEDMEYNSEIEEAMGSDSEANLSISDDENAFQNEETKSRFTHYSMTSSVIRRNNQLTLLDERFEKMYADYEDNEIGSLDGEEIEGHVLETSSALLQCIEEFEKKKHDICYLNNMCNKENVENDNEVEKNNEEKCTDSESSDTEYIYVPVEEEKKHDCQSILSTYSNLYNHPKLIQDPKDKPKSKIEINAKTGIPKNILATTKLTTQALNKLNEENAEFNSKDAKSIGHQSVISQLSQLSIRPKGETAEDRRERKKKLREYRKERRLEKKLNTEAFKQEAQRQIKININNKNNVQGNKIL